MKFTYTFNHIGIHLPYFIATLVFSFLCAAGIAQVKFSTVVADRQPALSDYVQVEFTIENAKTVEKVNTPSFKNFRVIQGPIQSDGMSYVNGVMSQYKSVTYILQPLAAGRLTIPGATALIDGKTMQSQPVAIEVKHQGTAKRNNVVPGLPSLFPREEPDVEEEYILKPGESASDKIKNNLLVRTDVNKTTCYEGEPIVATSVLCSRLKSESKVLKRPSLNGFSVYDMEDPEGNGPTIRAINGKPFNVHLIRKTQLFPLQSGTYIIDPVELDNTVRFIRKGAKPAGPRTRMQQLMDEMMNDGMQGELEEHNFTLASKPVSITVKPLPEVNKPEGFNGAVGRFTIQAKLKSNTVAAGDAAMLQVLVKGQGNFTVINPPLLSMPPGMEVYEPVVKEVVDKSVYPLSGTKTFEYTFTAKDTGTFMVPSIVFSYFDPSDAHYKTTSADSVSIHVTATQKKKRSFFFPRTTGSATGHANWIDAVPVSLLVLAAIVFIAAGTGMYQWRRNARKAVKKPARPATANEPKKPAADPLQQARAVMHEGSSQQFYSEVNKAVWNRLSELLHIPATELNKYNAVAKLQARGVDTGVTSGVQSVLNECEIALYTPAHTFTDMQQTLLKAEEVLKALQQSIT